MSLVSKAPQSVVYLEGRKDLAVTTQMAYGNDSSIMVATRPPGFHSKPHYHDSEQLNYVADGEMWIFIGEEGFPLKKGDFFRIPRNAVHWSWNRSDRPCILNRTLRGFPSTRFSGRPPRHCSATARLRKW